MHLIETYAVNCGSKIKKPFIYETFCPLPDEKYITFHTNTKFQSKNYDYWQDVVDIIFPILNKLNIKIVQTGLPNDKLINGAADYRGKTDINQLAFLIKNSSLHFGSDSLAIHLSSHYNIPIVSLYNIIQPECAGPYFGDKSKQILFKCYDRSNVKPSYAAEENLKTINVIFPEEIAAAIFKLLNIESSAKYKSVNFGERYGKVEVHDFVPNQVVDVPNKESVLDIRMDYHFNENNLAKQLQLNKCRIFTNKRINLDLIKNLKQSIDTIFYLVDNNDDPSFVKDVNELGIKIAILSEMSKEFVDSRKIDYYEQGNINILPKPNEDLVNKLKSIKNLYYKSCKTLYSGASVYSCLAAQKINKQKTGEFEPVIDTEDFWKEMDNFFFVEMLDKS